jgi:hypothetical protein
MIMKNFRHNETGRIVTVENSIMIAEYTANADFTEITDWAKIKLSYLEDMHGKRAARWESENDDRKLYSNIYRLMYEAVLTVASIENNRVHVAMNRQMREDFEVMAEIIMRFKSMKKGA